MTALAKDRDTKLRVGDIREFPVAAATKIFGGSLVVLDAAGNAAPGSVATTLTAIGRAEELVDNSAGAAADVTVKVLRGTFRWENSAAADLIAKAEIGDLCYIVDDQTVAKTNGTATRSVAGRIVDVDALGVWVHTDFNSLA